MNIGGRGQVCCLFTPVSLTNQNLQESCKSKNKNLKKKKNQPPASVANLKNCHQEQFTPKEYTVAALSRASSIALARKIKSWSSFHRVQSDPQTVSGSAVSQCQRTEAESKDRTHKGSKHDQSSTSPLLSLEQSGSLRRNFSCEKLPPLKTKCWKENPTGSICWAASHSGNYHESRWH